MHNIACDGLQLCAARALAMMLEICIEGKRHLRSDRRRRFLGEVATRLGIIVQYLNSLPPYWIEPDIEQQSKKILKELFLICIVRDAPSANKRGAWNSLL